MFSSRARLTKRTGKNPTGRYDFLKLLVTEYTTTSSKGKRLIHNMNIFFNSKEMYMFVEFSKVFVISFIFLIFQV